LAALDGVDERKMVFVIAATNRKDMIDEAVLRAGRIQRHLYVPRPDCSERE
jgi:transitional endoplasmic reticulum ATPase